MKKKKFIEPDFEIIEVEDIIKTSSFGETPPGYVGDNIGEEKDPFDEF